jgi:hypothetical protein
LGAVKPFLLLRTIKKINWTDANAGFSFLMVEIQPWRRAAREFVWYAVADSSRSVFRGNLTGRIGMKLAGFLLLVSGWGIVVATLPLLPSLSTRSAFALAGMAVEMIGLALVGRGHWVQKES